MANSERVSQVYSAGDYSYRNKRLFGDRWLLAGDAAGFIDPVFSSGVFLAIMSAEKAADSLDEILSDESKKPRLFREYSRRVNRVMDMYLAFVNSWYSGKEFVEVFLNPTDTLKLAPAVNAVLAGSDGEKFAIKWRMWVFYFIVHAQRFVSLSPRLSLVPREKLPLTPEPVAAIS
jgi:flavin-dependent dehydrogenase